MPILRIEKQECEDLLGQFLDEHHYDTVIEKDSIVYGYNRFTQNSPDGENNIAAIFIKNYFSSEEQIGAYDGLKEAAKPSQNRGLAAGPKSEKLHNRDWVTIEQEQILNYLSKVEEIPSESDIETIRARAKTMMDTRGRVWLSSKKEKHNFEFESWLVGLFQSIHTCDRVTAKGIREEAERVTSYTSDTTYANPVDSGIAGWFDRYPRIPYGRATSYTAHNFETFKKSWPFLRRLSNAFKKALPVRFAAQKADIEKLDPGFYVPGTVFTTITVNKNFRTAAHRDAGDLNSGFSNLTVVAKDGDYSGGYLIVPELRAAFNIRPGDLLLINNHEYIHGNTPIISATGKTEIERISLVCYFREAMLELGSVEYENARFEFVEARRTNKTHNEYRDGWNGVGTGMWSSQEWLDFLGSRKNGAALINQYHPIPEISSLDNIFD